MKYVLMYTSRPDLEEAIPPERRQEVYASIYGWFEKHAAVMADSGAELQGPETATSVKSPTEPGGEPVVVDGPFSEAKESVGGRCRRRWLPGHRPAPGPLTRVPRRRRAGR